MVRWCFQTFAQLPGRLKKILSSFAAMHQSALCDLGLRTCKQCRAMHRSQQAGQQTERRPS